MNSNGKQQVLPTPESICAQALELADNMKTLAAQSMEEATRLNEYADSAANNITAAVGRFSEQTKTLLTFIDRTTESCQLAIQSVNAFAGSTKTPQADMKALERAVTTGERR